MPDIGAKITGADRMRLPIFSILDRKTELARYLSTIAQ
jgi:hypothetical protein